MIGYELDFDGVVLWDGIVDDCSTSFGSFKGCFWRFLEDDLEGVDDRNGCACNFFSFCGVGVCSFPLFGCVLEDGGMTLLDGRVGESSVSFEFGDEGV